MHELLALIVTIIIAIIPNVHRCVFVVACLLFAKFDVDNDKQETERERKMSIYVFAHRMMIMIVIHDDDDDVASIQRVNRAQASPMLLLSSNLLSKN